MGHRRCLVNCYYNLGAFSRLGAALDPVADKLMITVCMLSFALISLIPWWLAIAVICRDLVIVAGASCYHWLIGQLEFEPTSLSKANMFVQIAFCILVLTVQVMEGIPAQLLEYSQWLVLAVAVLGPVHLAQRAGVGTAPRATAKQWARSGPGPSVN